MPYSPTTWPGGMPKRARRRAQASRLDARGCALEAARLHHARVRSGARRRSGPPRRRAMRDQRERGGEHEQRLCRLRRAPPHARARPRDPRRAASHALGSRRTWRRRIDSSAPSNASMNDPQHEAEGRSRPGRPERARALRPRATPATRRGERRLAGAQARARDRSRSCACECTPVRRRSSCRWSTKRTTSSSGGCTATRVTRNASLGTAGIVFHAGRARSLGAVDRRQKPGDVARLEPRESSASSSKRSLRPLDCVRKRERARASASDSATSVTGSRPRQRSSKLGHEAVEQRLRDVERRREHEHLARAATGGDQM